MANDIQMGEPKADVHPPDMISDAISQPEEAAGLEATPMAVEAAAGATAEAMTEATPEAVVEETMEAVPKATTQATREAIPGAAAEATTEATPEATTEDKTQGSKAQTEALTEAKTEATTEAKTAAVADGAEGSHAPTGGDDAVVDEVIDAADDFGSSRVVEREGSENGNYDEPSSRRGRRGRSRSRSRDRVGAGANGDNSRDRGRRRDNEDRERERDHDRSRGRDRDVGSSREHRDRGRDDSRDRNRGGNGGRDRDRGRENSRERERGRGSSRDRDWSRDERDWGRGRDRDSFDNTRDRGRQSGGHGQGSITHRRDRGPAAPMDGGRMDGGRAGGREPFRGRGPPGTGPMMQPMGGGSLPMMQPMGGPGAPMFPPPASAHGQMVFSTNQRPQPMKMAGQTRMYNILPMISFKAFMAEQREDVTPEECKQRYDEYKADYTQRLTHSFIDVHRKEEWLLERYHPKMIQQKKEDKIKWVAQESAAFALQLRANPVAFIASAALDPISEQQRWGGVDKRKKRPRVSSRDETSVDGMEDDSDQPGESEPKDGSGDYDMDAKEFSAHTDKVVFIRRVPAWISTEELGRQVVIKVASRRSIASMADQLLGYLIAVEAPKHERIVCSDAANTRNEDFARSAFIIYDTPEKAAKSVQKLNKMRIYQNQKPKAKVSKKVSNGDSKYFELKTFSYKPRTHTAADHDFSDAKRIVHDTRQSLKVAEAMDEEFGRTYMPESIAMLLREPEIQEALSSSPAGTAELDLVCAYMKRVHLYLYYRGQQCRDEGDMISSRSACRGTEAASKEDVQEAFRLADAETLATMDGDTPSASGRGVGAGTADNGAAASAARGGKKREFGTEYVDECAINRIKDAGRAEERNKKDGAILERYEARVKEDVEAWQNLHTGRTEEGYARCGMAKCAKLFKAAEFVHKHLINKHPEKHKVVVDQATDPFVRELFFADDVKPLPNIVADANTPPVVLLPGAMAMGGSVPAMPPVPPPMGAPGFPMMGGGMPMGPMGPMGPPGQMGGMGDFPMQMQMPPDVMMGSGGRGFRGGRGGGGGGGPSFRGRGSGGGGRFGGRGMGRMDNRPVEPIGPRDPRSLVSYIDVDAPKETTPNLDYGDAFPSRSKKKRKTM